MVLGFSSTTDTAAGITAVAPVGVNAVTTTVTITSPKSAVIQVPFGNNMCLVSQRGMTCGWAERESREEVRFVIVTASCEHDLVPDCGLFGLKAFIWFMTTLSIYSRLGQSERLSNILTLVSY